MSTDPCLQILIDKARSENKSALWLLDESFPPDRLGDILPHANADANTHASTNAIVTNRYHLLLAGKQHDAPVVFNDFDLNHLAQAFPERVYYRVSKEKAVTHYLINQVFRLLPVGGTLFLSGFKTDGIKSYADKGKKLFACNTPQENHAQGAKLICLSKHRTAAETDLPLLDDKDYRQSRSIFELQGKPVLSKPGQFGWNKEDAGSEFLISHVNELTASLKAPIASVLDLGCGYGYISLQAFYHCPALSKARFTLTDNNAAAIDCARQNLENHQLPGKVISDDCGSQINEQFDLILCNPPFHQGFDVSQDITRHFLQNTRRLLKADGKALFVVNQFVGIEKKATEYFAGVSELARNKSFKLIVLAKPKKAEV